MCAFDIDLISALILFVLAMGVSTFAGYLFGRYQEFRPHAVEEWPRLPPPDKR